MSSLQHRRRARRGDALRQRLEAAVERAIAALDAYDGDADLEPSLGSIGDRWPSDQRGWVQGAADERESDVDEREPSCGWNLRAGEVNSASLIDPATVWEEP